MSLTLIRRPLILDLDFTLLHLEYVPDALEVPGRTRSAWLAPQTIECLSKLQTQLDLVLATARSWDGTRWVSEGLAERGVQISGVVLEDGALLGTPGVLRNWTSSFDVETLRVQVEEKKTSDWPWFEGQFDFKACLVARCELATEASQLSLLFEKNFTQEQQRRIYRDGRKVYILPLRADKWSALRELLGARAEDAIGVGDGANDLAWLPRVEFPATFACANGSLVEAVQKHGGYISPLDGHQGIVDILSYISEKVVGQTR